jgi:GntR family transcriptional repressor for pyruvate dehydrogenase complex
MEQQYVTFKPVHKDLLHAKIADAIVEYIKTNQLASGDKLPSERVLAEQFVTSRNSVREALRVLERDGIIEVRAGSGAFVKAHEESDSFYLKLWKVNYIEILEVQEILEENMVMRICGSLTPEQIRPLEESLDKMERYAAEKGIFFHEEDIAFHRTMRSYCGNQMLIQLIDELIQSLHSYWKNLKGEDEKWISTLPYHRKLVEGIRDNELPKARKALKKICEIDKDILEYLQESADKGE